MLLQSQGQDQQVDASQYTFFGNEGSDFLDGALEDGIEVPPEPILLEPEDQDNHKELLNIDAATNDILKEVNYNKPQEVQQEELDQANSFDQIQTLLKDSDFDDVSSQLKDLNIQKDMSQTIQDIAKSGLNGHGDTQKLYSNLQGKGVIDFIKLFQQNNNGKKENHQEFINNGQDKDSSNIDTSTFGGTEEQLSENKAKLPEAQNFLGQSKDSRPNSSELKKGFKYPQSSSVGAHPYQVQDQHDKSFQNNKMLGNVVQNLQGFVGSRPGSVQGQSHYSNQDMTTILPGQSQSIVNNKSFPKTNPLILNQLYQRTSTPFTPPQFDTQPPHQAQWHNGQQMPNPFQPNRDQVLSSEQIQQLNQIRIKIGIPADNSPAISPPYTKSNFEHMNGPQINGHLLNGHYNGQQQASQGQNTPKSTNFEALISQIGKQQQINPEVLRHLSLQNFGNNAHNQGNMSNTINALRQVQMMSSGSNQNMNGGHNMGQGNLGNLNIGPNNSFNNLNSVQRDPNRQFPQQLIPGLFGNQQNVNASGSLAGIQNKLNLASQGIGSQVVGNGKIGNPIYNQNFQNNNNQPIHENGQYGGEYAWTNGQSSQGQFLQNLPNLMNFQNQGLDQGNLNGLRNLPTNLQNQLNMGSLVNQTNPVEKQHSQYFNKVLLQLNKEISEMLQVNNPAVKALVIKKKLLDLEQPLQKLAQERINAIYADRMLQQQLQQSRGPNNQSLPYNSPVEVMQWQLHARQFLMLAEEIRAFRLTNQNIDMNYILSLSRINNIQYQRQILLQQQKQQQLQNQNPVELQQRQQLERALEQQKLRDLIKNGSLSNGTQQNKELNQGYVNNMALLQRLNSKQKYFG